jgi:hypothetical protein
MISVDVWSVSWSFGLWLVLLRLSLGSSNGDSSKISSDSEAIALLLVLYFVGVFFARVTLSILSEFGVIA